MFLHPDAIIGLRSLAAVGELKCWCNKPLCDQLAERLRAMDRCDIGLSKGEDDSSLLIVKLDFMPG
jgi:hypothetical protein